MRQQISRWRAPLDPPAQAVYAQLMRRLQRDLLVLLVGCALPFGIIFGISLAQQVWVSGALPPATLGIHWINVALSVGCAAWLLRRGAVVGAWVAVQGSNVLAILLQLWLLGEPGVLLFVLPMVAGLALVAPLRVALAVIGALLVGLLLLSWGLPPEQGQWSGVATMFAAISLALACTGVVIRRGVAQFAQTLVAAEATARQQGKLEQQLLDLHQRAEQLASLEHDLRQPLRTVQGCLSALAAEADGDLQAELITPAMAAAGRADRLINNLLEQARAEAAATRSFPGLTRPEGVLARVAQAAPGLARYYTDPPVTIRFEVADPLPLVPLDHEQLERALLNLLDNALAVSPPDGTIVVRVTPAPTALRIDVEDEGPGIPASLAATFALPAQTPPAHPLMAEQGQRRARRGLGLRQVQTTLLGHGGTLTFERLNPGTRVRLELPLAPGRAEPTPPGVHAKELAVAVGGANGRGVP